MYKYTATFDTIRSVAGGSVTGSFAIVGTATTNGIVAFSLKNQTDGDVIVSLDGTNAMLYIPANSYAVWDIRTNAPFNTDYMFPVGTSFFVKQGTVSPSTGTFYIETMKLINSPSTSVS